MTISKKAKKTAVGSLSTLNRQRAIVHTSLDTTFSSTIGSTIGKVRY